MNALNTTPLAPVSWGELLDKIAILEIKQDRICDAERRRHVLRELALLSREAVLERHTAARRAEELEAALAALSVPA